MTPVGRLSYEEVLKAVIKNGGRATSAELAVELGTTSTPIIKRLRELNEFLKQYDTYKFQIVDRGAKRVSLIVECSYKK
jgi:hypothetical protein